MPALLALSRKLYPTMVLTEESIQWQYFDNPAGEAKIWMCFDKEMPIGIVTAIPHKVWALDQMATGYRVQGVMTDPNYRGRAIYRRLSEICYGFLDEDKTAVHFTFPNEKSDRVFRTSSWTPVGSIPLWTTTPQDQGEEDALPSGCRFIDTFSAVEEEIWAASRSAGILGIDKNPDYLNWRYFDNPIADYQCFRMDRGRSSAVFILKKFHLDSGEIAFHLCDLFYSRIDQELLNDVLLFVHKRACKENANFISAWISPTSEMAALASAVGFSYTPVTSRSFFLRSANAAAMSKPESWNIQMGDSDVY